MYFKSCKCIEELKELYKKLALANHPDRGGNAEVMKAINAEYDTYFEKLKNIHRNTKADAKENPYYESKKGTCETAGEFRSIIEKLIILEGLTIELCGRWIWVTGETKKHRETLKVLGMRWCPKKLAWSWHKAEDDSYSRGNWDLNQIRERYGSTQFARTEHPEEEKAGLLTA